MTQLTDILTTLDDAANGKRQITGNIDIKTHKRRKFGSFIQERLYMRWKLEAIRQNKKDYQILEEALQLYLPDGQPQVQL